MCCLHAFTLLGVEVHRWLLQEGGGGGGGGAASLGWLSLDCRPSQVYHLQLPTKDVLADAMLPACSCCICCICLVDCVSLAIPPSRGGLLQ